jgi:RNA recognition motif-containing protein
MAPQLPFHCQWQDLKDLFRQAGKIIRADVALGQDGRSRGFGTVVYATEADAERAVLMFNGFVPSFTSSNTCD